VPAFIDVPHPADQVDWNSLFFVLVLFQYWNQSITHWDIIYSSMDRAEVVSHLKSQELIPFEFTLNFLNPIPINQLQLTWQVCESMSKWYHFPFLDYRVFHPVSFCSLSQATSHTSSFSWTHVRK
jgi:hypothetical protein